MEGEDDAPTVVIVEGDNNVIPGASPGTVAGEPVEPLVVDTAVSDAIQAETSAVVAQAAAEGAVALANVQAALTEAQVAEYIAGMQTWQSQVGETLATMQAALTATQTELSELRAQQSSTPQTLEAAEVSVVTINPADVEADHPAAEPVEDAPRSRYRLRI